MRDLYKAIGLSSMKATEDDIRTQLSSVAEPLKSDVAYVLLHEGRRRVYDRNYRALTQIGILRARFGDAIADEYWGREYADFTLTASREKPPNDEAGSASSRPASPKKKSKRTGIVVGPILVAIAVIVIVSVISAKQNSTRTVPSPVPERSVTAAEQTPAQDKPSQLEPAPPAPKKNAPTELTAEEKRQLAIEQFKAEHPVLALPATGVLERNYAQGLAPFEIVTRESDVHYYIKLVNAQTNNTVLTAFIRSGDRVETEVPLGNCVLRYATGKEWFGEDDRFGPETSGFEADDVFEFQKSYQGYSGFTVELYVQPGGNLGVDPIPMSEF